MGRFFIQGIPQETEVISGEDGRHIARSLRMKEGEALTLCNGEGLDFEGQIEKIEGDSVTVRILKERKSTGEPDLAVYVYQGVPKLDKMDWIAQKFVECGGAALRPVLTARCVSRPDRKAADRKQERWNRIAQEAAKQCGRGKLPQVLPMIGFEKAIREASDRGPVIFFYEGGGIPLRRLIGEEMKTLSIFIGPEGGFAAEEVELAKTLGASVGSMGPRILRTETAAVAALSAIMALSGNLE